MLAHGMHSCIPEVCGVFLEVTSWPVMFHSISGDVRKIMICPCWEDENLNPHLIVEVGFYMHLRVFNITQTSRGIAQSPDEVFHSR